MIFANKLVQLRKKTGWSQEELAEQMNVSRQTVSKWESAQSIPDLERIIRLSQLFGVSTDYLLKDEIEEAECVSTTDEGVSLRRVSMEEANAFLSAKKYTSNYIALATLLCILSPICLFLLGAVSQIPEYHLAENIAGGIGMIVLLLLVTIAVAIFIVCGRRTAEFEYLEKESFETSYGVQGMVTERKTQYSPTYTRNNIFGAAFCILAPIPLFAGAIINEADDLLLTIMLSLMLILIGIGVMFFVRTGIVWASYEKLLQEGDYTKEKKKRSPIISAVSTAYWLIATAIYLGYSFTTNNWEHTWIVWPVAGVIYPVVVLICNAFIRIK